jgi:hypothetical protein
MILSIAPMASRAATTKEHMDNKQSVSNALNNWKILRRRCSTCLSALKGCPNQRTVVDLGPSLMLQRRKTPIRGFSDDKAEFIDVANNVECVRDLGNLACKRSPLPR